MVIKIGSGNKLQRQMKGPLELSREKCKGNTSEGEEEGDRKGTDVLPRGREPQTMVFAF